MKTTSIRSCFRLPPGPTSALPGTEEKVRILAERRRLGVSLWHPLDARLPGAISQPLLRLADLGLAS
jgi:hypothetical protein